MDAAAATGIGEDGCFQSAVSAHRRCFGRAKGRAAYWQEARDELTRNKK
jgi:hypothetical protein